MYYAALYNIKEKSLMIFDTVKDKTTNVISMPNGFMEVGGVESLAPTEISKYRDDIEMSIIEANFRGISTLNDVKFDEKNEQTWFKSWTNAMINEPNDHTAGFIQVNDFEISWVEVVIKQQITYTIGSYTDEHGGTHLGEGALQKLDALAGLVEEIEKKLNAEAVREIGKDATNAFKPVINEEGKVAGKIGSMTEFLEAFCEENEKTT